MSEVWPAATGPFVTFLLAAAISFATGTSWGTYAVVFPLAMPLAWALHPDPHYIEVCFAAVLGGGVQGEGGRSWSFTKLAGRRCRRARFIGTGA